MSIRCLRRWACMGSGWIEGLGVSSVCKEQDASFPMKRSLLYCYCYVLLMFSYVSVHGNYGEGFVGLCHQQKHHWILPLFELWVWDCISKTQLCTKEHIGVYNAIRTVISLLINQNLDFDIQNSVLVLRKNTCCCDRAAQCPWWLTGSCWSWGALVELPWGSQWNM